MIGLVALADLHHRYRWDPRPTDAIAELLGLVRGEDVIQRFEPPGVVVAIATTPEQVDKSRAWLARATRVLVVYDRREGGDAPVDSQFETHVWREPAELASIVAHARLVEHEDWPDPPSIVDDLVLPFSPWIPHADQLMWSIPQQLDRIAAGELQLIERVRGLVGADPTTQVSWGGERMGLWWSYGGGFVDVMLHDWPCGPEKKVWGHSNNYPRQVCMTPERTAFVARFDHDATFSTHVPVRWQRAGDIHVAAFAPDPQRTTFFVCHEHYEAEDDENSRSAPPAIVLGPSLYAVALDQEVFRVRSPEEHIHVGGPDDGYEVYDFDHELLRRGEGLLLGGWYRHATIEHDGQWWREDLATGVRTRLGPADYRRCVDPVGEAVAADATLAGRLDDAARIRDSYETVRELRDEYEQRKGYFGIPGTRNIIYIANEHYRVI